MHIFHIKRVVVVLPVHSISTSRHLESVLHHGAIVYPLMITPDDNVRNSCRNGTGHLLKKTVPSLAIIGPNIIRKIPNMQ